MELCFFLSKTQTNIEVHLTDISLSVFQESSQILYLLDVTSHKFAYVWRRASALSFLSSLYYLPTCGVRVFKTQQNIQEVFCKLSLKRPLPKSRTTAICNNLWSEVLNIWAKPAEAHEFPLKNISQLGWLFPIYGRIKNVPNHQPDSYYTINNQKPSFAVTWSALKSVKSVSLKSAAGLMSSGCSCNLPMDEKMLKALNQAETVPGDRVSHPEPTAVANSGAEIEGT